MIAKDTMTSKTMLLWHKDENAPCSKNKMILKSTPVVYITDLEAVVTQRLNDCEAAGKLTFGGFPRMKCG